MPAAELPTTPPARFRAHYTLVLCVILHAFTHAYTVLLVPLYLLIKSDLALPGIKSAALVVTVYGVVYNFGSYVAGILADRFDRRVLLATGLLGNAAAIAGIGLTRDYHAILALAVAAGLFGTLFHPAANALVCAHYPRNPGLAIGLLGVGSGLGFFAGPQYAGWRAEHAAWHWGSVSQWQKPCVELGAAGMIFGLLFLLAGHEAGREKNHYQRPPLGKKLFRTVAALSMVLGWRDFAGYAAISLASIYLQRACGMNVGQAGFIIGAMMLVGMIVNPLAALLSSGRRRLPTLSVVCLCAGAILATTPLWPVSMVLVPLCGYQTLQLASYAVSDAATLERVAPAVRGRVVGVFLTCAGTWAAISPWWMGYWTDRLGPRAAHPAGYIAPFATLGAVMAFSSFSSLVIRRMGEPTGEKPITPAEEIMPATEGFL
jgi:MFS family permease